MPGGATWFNQTDGFADAGRHLYEIAMRMNDRGEVMPIFGTCLGFELFAYITSTEGDPRSDCSSDRQPLQLDFEPGRRPGIGNVLNKCKLNLFVVLQTSGRVDCLVRRRMTWWTSYPRNWSPQTSITSAWPKQTWPDMAWQANGRCCQWTMTGTVLNSSRPWSIIGKLAIFVVEHL